MQATTTNNGTVDQQFTLQLSFIEMHIVMQAMQAYHRDGYGTANADKPNWAHSEAAEKLHDELLEIYTV